MVIGAPGSGTISFCRYLAAAFCRSGKRVAWIDADPGQPFLGPPGVYSITLLTDPAEIGRRAQPVAMGFIGNTSPVGHLLDCTTSLQKLLGRARAMDPDLVVINASGLVDGGAARELHFHSIDIAGPRYLVALQRASEVEHLILPHVHRSHLLVLRLPVAPDGEASTTEVRKKFREQRFKEFFRGADYQDIALSDVGVHGPGLGTGERLGFRDINLLSKSLQAIVVHAEQAADRLFVITEGEYAEGELFAAKERFGAREISVVRKEELSYLLVGLNDDHDHCLSLGIIRDLDVREMVLKVVTPLKDVSPVRYLAMGSLRVNPAGGELGRW